MLIQVDVDSTLYDADKLFDQLSREAGIKWPRKDNCWKLAHEISREDGTPCSRDDLVRVFRKAHSREQVMKNKPYPYAAETLGRIAQELDDVEIAYVSDRSEQQSGALRDWLQANGFLYSDDQFVAATKDKRHWMREKRPEIVIDDRVRTMLMARYELGSLVVSLQHNHNVNLRNEVEGIYIVPDWKAIDAVLWDEIIPAVQERSVSHEKIFTR